MRFRLAKFQYNKFMPFSATDRIPASLIDGLPGSTVISGTAVLNFGNEGDSVVLTVLNGTILNSSITSVSFIPIETTETSLDDFNLNGVTFSIENIIDGVSFDIRGTAQNNATGNYTVKYLIA